MSEIQHFIDKQSKQIEFLEKLIHQAWWNLATTGDDTYAKKLQSAQTELRKLFSSRADFEFLNQHLESDDPVLKREITLLHHSYRENQIDPKLIDQIVALETEIESIYTNFRAEVRGLHLSSNEVKKILVESKDLSKRQEAWEASKKIGEDVQEKIFTLIKLRNESAKQAGFKDFYSMRLELQELDQDRLFELLGQLDRVTAIHWQSYKPSLDESLSKKLNVSTDALMPWHYMDPFFQEAPVQETSLDVYYKDKDIVNISRQFFESIGLHIDDILERSDLFERDKKNQHAFCTCIDRKQDVRILCNLRDNEYWMGTQLHELGHAVYDKYIDQTLPFLLRTTAHTSTTEAIAMLFGRLSKSGEFLHKFCHVDAKTAEKLGAASKKTIGEGLLVFARWILVMTHFERAMYQQPDADFNTLWWDLVEQYQWVNRPPKRNKPDWASKLHLACAPVYYQNYILGEMTASQLQHAMGGNSMAPNVGDWLKKRLFRFGAKAHWELTLQRATGELLNPKYFADDL